MDSYVGRYLERRGDRRVDERIASRVLSKPLHYGSMMVGMGDADGVVAGANNLTASVIKAGKLLIGLEEGISEPSSFFIMDVPGRDHLVFADCAVNPDPDSNLLAQIAVSSASSARTLLGVEPRVAMLSFSTKGSADHPHVRKVIDATKIASQMDPALKIDGEMQADSAIVPEIAKRKRASDILVGGANVLVFPDLDAGNIAYKLVQHLARASAFGPFLQGFRRPINDLSRGCTVEEVIGAIMVTSVQAESNR
jgi:phosphate acetyltransferase